MRSKAERPVWINERTAPGQVTLDGKTYTIGKHDYPCDEAAERDVIGSLLVAGEIGKGNETLMRIPFLHYDDFFFLRHAYIFRAMERLYLREHQIDLATVASELEHQEKDGQTYLARVGGAEYLVELTSVLAQNYETYAEMVVLRAIDRAMIALGDVIADIGRNRRMEMREKLVELQRTVQNLTIRANFLENRNTTNSYDALAAHAEQFNRELQEDDFQPGISTGFVSLDKVTLGWRKSRLYIFAAPSGWGKTALLLSSALKALKNGQRVLYISLEMSLPEILDRFICIQGSVNGSHLIERKLTPDEVGRVRQAMQEIREMRESKNFMIACMRRPTLAELRAKVAEFHPFPGIDVVFVDYVIANTFSDPTNAEEFAFVTAIYSELESIKRDFDIPVVAATQMNSKWERRKGRRPEMGDLYYGKAGQFAADVIAFIYQEALASDDPETKDAEIILRKNRSGPMNRDVTIELKWEPEFTRFSDGPNPAPNAPRQIDLGEL